MSKKVAVIIAKENFRDEEYQYPRDEFENVGFKVTVYSSEKKKSKGMMGMEVVPDDIIDNLEPDDFNAVVFVGGGGASEYFNNSLAHSIATSFYEKEKLVAAICIAPNILAQAGLLNGKKACCFPSVKKDLENKGAHVQPEGVAQDGNIITATGPDYATHFGKAIVKYLS